uniref:Interleukin-1 receptor-associated kinase 1 binding protein 1 n=1 Tax=Lepisosteus oculatus TaxID=7918 RepID=W5NHD3_LEPOC
FGAMAGSVSRVFAALAPASDFIYRDENESGRGDRRPTPRQPIPGREVQVTGSAELSAPPDRARLNLWVSSRKESVTDVKNSVSRRLDYILQVTRQHGVKEENVTVTKDIRRVENAYHMEVEVCVIFSDFVKMQNVSNLLVEKLDSSVTVCTPVFYHTTESLEKLSERRQVCLVAVENARHKAREVCRMVGQAVGRPLLIKEEDTKEWQGQTEETAEPEQHAGQQRIGSATVFVTSSVFISFEIKPKEKGRKKT